MISEALVIQYQLPNRLRQLFTLPLALAATGSVLLTFGSRCSHSLDRISCSTELMCGNV